MKHILLIAILFVSTFSFAQYPMGGGMMGGRRTGMGNNYGNMATNTPAKERVFSAEERAQNLTDMMGKKLDLDSNQYAKTSEINLRYAKKQEEFMLISQTENLPNEIMYKKMKDFKIGSDYRKENEFKTILNPEQFEKYLKFKKNNESHFGYQR